jgi:hypothetical protein
LDINVGCGNAKEERNTIKEGFDVSLKHLLLPLYLQFHYNNKKIPSSLNLFHTHAFGNPGSVAALEPVRC